MTQPKDKLDTPACKDSVDLYGLALAGSALINQSNRSNAIGQNGLKLGEAVIQEKCGVSPREASAHFQAQKPTSPKP